MNDDATLFITWLFGATVGAVVTAIWAACKIADLKAQHRQVCRSAKTVIESLRGKKGVQ